MKTIQRFVLIALLLAACVVRGYSQHTVFGLFTRDVQLGDKYYQANDFHGALQLYLTAAHKNPKANDVQLLIARCYYSLKQYENAADAYDRHLKEKDSMPPADLYNYAEIKSIMKDYPTAIEYYRRFLKHYDDEAVRLKVWRLSNIKYLYEDSIYYAVRRLPINSDFGDLCAVPYQNMLVFMSNRKETQVVKKVNAALNAPFYDIYTSSITCDTAAGRSVYGRVSLLDKEFSSRYNAGPVAFYEYYKKMVFVSNAGPSVGSKKTLQLFFAERKNNHWEVSHSFPFNSTQYNISDPSITEDGTMLYFSSDMDGGFGGKDIYSSVFNGEQWSKPTNAGEDINTPRDEVFPFLHQNRTLYFSSNGHPGLGGLDIFQCAVKSEGFSEPVNMGYPINSTYDDFGFVLDSLETHGYLSSNRRNGEYDDDIYEFDMDLLAYPVTINGVIKYKEHAWKDSTEATILANTLVYLIDNLEDTTVAETTTDVNGNFTLNVPYLSRYSIRVTDAGNKTNDVTLEIPKRRKQIGPHEIVIIKNVF